MNQFHVKATVTAEIAEIAEFFPKSSRRTRHAPLARFSFRGGSAHHEETKKPERTRSLCPKNRRDLRDPSFFVIAPGEMCFSAWRSSPVPRRCSVTGRR